AGADALWLLDQAARVGEPYDGVVCDVNLPDMSAFDFARSVRANPAHGDVRVAMCAMLISGADPESFREAGVADMLCKPVRRADLVRAFGGPARQAAAAVQAPAIEPADAAPYRARVLVAEDNMVNQEIVIAMLENLGCDVAVAANGLEAVQ